MKLRVMLSITALCGALGAAVLAQSVPDVKLPASPPGQAAIQLGGRWDKTAEGGQRYVDGKWIVVNYSRPVLRGRTEIFGAGAEYGTFVKAGDPVWRAGANETTRLTTQAPLQIGGTTIAPGVYNLFVDLKPGSWTLVLNTQPLQEKFDPNDKVRLFGATNYDSKFDVLRVPMTTRASEPSIEQFTIEFVNVSATSATLALAWEKTRASVDIRLAAATK
ncbi:MAG: DUF2911 domain-containing protein [Acidobacteriota bacterium]